MPLLYRLIIAALLAAGPAAAAVNDAIAVGAFRTSAAAQERLEEIRAFLNSDQTVSDMLKARRFGFTVEPVQGFYRAELTNFAENGDLPVVLRHIKKYVPDAYTVSVSSDGPTPVIAKEHAADVVGTTMEGSIVIMDGNDSEQEETESKNVVKESVTPVAATETEIVSESVEPEMPAIDTASLLWIGIAVALLIIIVLLFGARRKKAPFESIPTAEKRPWEPQAAPAAEAPAVSETKAPAEAVPAEEEIPAELPAVEEAPVAVAPVEEYVEELPAAETPSVAAEAEAEIPREAETAPAAVETTAPVVTRKKRDLPADLGQVTKERLAEFSGNRLLIAEDNLINQKVISRLLEGSGMEIVIANNGQEALDILGDDPSFNMVLMDAHMPIKDGFQATREIRENPRYDAIVVVALSGDVGSDDIRKMRDAGMEEQLAKPLRIEALYDVMYQYLDLAGEDVDEVRESMPEREMQRAVAVLDTEEGLEICGGDREMYTEILDEFTATYGSAGTLVHAYLQADDDDNLVALMLDIKGVAANIGADALSEAAETLREAVLINRTDVYARLGDEFGAELMRALTAIDDFKKKP